MEQNAKPRVLNLGCGFKKYIGGVNVDAYDSCAPDIIWDLGKTPWEWAEDESFDVIYAHHIFEHLIDWWPAFEECARVLKVGGIFEMRLPDESSSTALSYRDHHHLFTPWTFHGLQENHLIPYRSGTNAWAVGIEGKIPLKTIHYMQVPFPRFNWMMRWPFRRVLSFCARHMRNFIWEQVFVFEKVKPDVSA